MEIPHSAFEEKLERMKDAKGVKLDTDLTSSDLKELVKQYKKVYLEVKGEEFPSGTKFNTNNFLHLFQDAHNKFKLMPFFLHYLQIQKSNWS